MPKTKKAATSASSATGKKAKAAKKIAPRTIRPKKKVKSILVDVIEDEPLSDWPEEKIEPAPLSARRRLSDPHLTQDGDEIDQQKRFYAKLADQMKEDRPEKSAKKTEGEGSQRRSVGLYRRLVIRFVILVFVIAAAVAYFSFSKLTIVLSLTGESLSNNLLLKVAGEAEAAEDSDESAAASSESLPTDDALDPREDISGTVKSISVSVTETYSATGETFLGDDVTGRVRIINNYTRSQPLVATTRLLTPDNKMFRIKEAVNVPAGGEVTVEVYADKPSADLAVGPTSFTIPGLWAGLQDRIYAKSDEAFVFTKKVQKHVNSSDLELAAKDINARLLEEAKKEADAALGGDWLYQADGSPNVTLDAKIGDQKDEFTASASGKIIAVSFDRAQAAALAQAKLNLIIPSGKELAGFESDRINYSLENYDAESGVATIKASFTGTMILKKEASIIDPRQLVNLTAEQIGTYLRDRPEIKEYELDFSPSFIKKAPSLADRISIEINKNE